MKGITAFVWSYNEEKRLPITLRQLKEFDEVVVLDKSSTDNSADVARSFGCKVYVVPYFESMEDPKGAEAVREIWNSCQNEWIFQVTCSDVYHPALYIQMKKIINDYNDCEAVYVPIYRYSMGFISKHSVYGDITYQAWLFKRDSYNLKNVKLHGNPLANAHNVKYLKPSDKKIAIYHLTHENLELVMERHLRYARIEADEDRKGERATYLRLSWRSVLRVVKNYIRLRTYKLGDRGKAQLCMLLMYRCANYLNLYFSAEEEEHIKSVYDKIRNGDFSEVKSI